MKIILISFILAGCAMTAQKATWPNNAVCAVCLTYDDAYNSQLDIAVPLLDQHGFRATFYIDGQEENFDQRLDEWRAIAAKGHELGNHTLFHPCLEYRDGEHRQWLTDDFKMENYTLDRFMRECRVANVLLKAVDGQCERSFAYTCCDTWVDDHISLLDPLRKLFSCARGIGATPTDLEFDLMNVPSYAVINHSGDDLIEQVKIAESAGSVVVFLFHGIDESHLPVTRAAHQQLVEYLDAHRSRIWTEPFLNVMNHLDQLRQSEIK